MSYITYRIYETDENHLTGKSTVMDYQERVVLLSTDLKDGNSIEEAYEIIKRDGVAYTNYTILPHVFITMNYSTGERS